MNESTNPYTPPTAPLNDEVTSGSSSSNLFYTVGNTKFIILSVATFGVFPLYWFYKNWKVASIREDRAYRAFWRALFLPLWTFSMGSHFIKYGEAAGITLRLATVPLGVLYLIFNLSGSLPDPYWIASMVAFVPLIPFEAAACALNNTEGQEGPTKPGYSWIQILLIVVGIGLACLAILSAFLPPEVP